MRELLGGKGANIAEMTRHRRPGARARRLHDHDRGLRRLHARRAASRPGLEEQVDEALARLEAQRRQAARRPATTRCSSRCARARASRCRGCSTPSSTSGLNDESVEGLARAPATSASRWDSYRRFVQMFGNVVRGIDGDAFEDAIQAARQRAGVELDTELDAGDLRELVDDFKRIFERTPARSSRATRASSCARRSAAVFDSWNGERAVDYRRLNRIPDDWGTAVNVQQMVFGNKGDDVRLGRRVQPRREHRARPSRRGDFLAERAGRGRRLGRAQHARPRRAAPS